MNDPLSVRQMRDADYQNMARHQAPDKMPLYLRDGLRHHGRDGGRFVEEGI